jgi:hypothetical protein
VSRVVVVSDDMRHRWLDEDVPTAQIVLSDEEREALQRWARRPTTGQALALCCWIVLPATDGALNREFEDDLGCNAVTVGK